MGLIRQQKQTQMNRDNTRENKHIVDYEYKVGDKVMLTNHTVYKYETPYKDTYVITKCFTNGMLTLMKMTCGRLFWLHQRLKLDQQPIGKTVIVRAN